MMHLLSYNDILNNKIINTLINLISYLLIDMSKKVNIYLFLFVSANIKICTTDLSTSGILKA